MGREPSPEVLNRIAFEGFVLFVACFCGDELAPVVEAELSAGTALQERQGFDRLRPRP